MGQVLHGFVRTTAAVRRALQHSQKSLHELAEQYGINPKTVAKWKKRGFANDAPMGPKEVRSTVLTEEKETATVALSRQQRLRLVLPRTSVWPPRAAAWDKKRHWGVAKR
jgi:hypothetical protein